MKGDSQELVFEVEEVESSMIVRGRRVGIGWESVDGIRFDEIEVVVGRSTL